MNTVAKLRQVAIIFIAAAVIIAYLSVALGTNVDSKYLAGLALSATALAISYVFYRRYKYQKLVIDLKEGWGKTPNRKRNFAMIREVFDDLAQDGSGFSIDERTWQDLNMNEILARIDHTVSTVGQQMLYYVLRTPRFVKTELEERGRIISLFQRDKRIRLSLQVPLAQLGFLNEGSAWWLINHKLGNSHRQLAFYRVLFAVTILSVASLVVSPTIAGILISVLFVVNMGVHYRVQQKVQGHLSSIKYAAQLITCATKIAEVQCAEITNCQNEIKEIIPRVRRLRSLAGILGTNTGVGDVVELIAQYIKIFFLSEARSFAKAATIIQACRKELRTLYQIVGEIDALLSVASYRDGEVQTCVPIFGPNMRLEIKGLYHPLIEDPVPNDIVLEKNGVLVTGSNMSGKSTFLRSVGINVLMSQTIYTCPSGYYKGRFYKLMTSIGRSDNVIEGKSYYLVEAQVLKRILDSLEDRHPTFSIVDEIFRGTNSMERIASSHRVLEYLAKKNCISFAASHDLELTELLDNLYENYHFRETVGKEGLRFDYLLKRGPSQTRNAINLLRFMNYPAEIVSKGELDVAKALD